MQGSYAFGIARKEEIRYSNQELISGISMQAMYGNMLSIYQ